VTASPQGSSASFVVQYRLRAGASREFSRLFGDLTDSLSTAGGFEGTEVHFDAAGTSPTVVWRFATVDEARTWSKSATMETFERSLEPYSVAKPVHNVILNAGRSGAASTVITTRVKPGSDSWFADWQGRMGAAQQQFPGYVGQRVQAPVPGVNADWVAIVAFDSPEDLRVWTDSPERQALVTESEPYVERYYVRPADSAFESWFAKSDAGGKPPPGWKLSAIVLLVLYPIVMLEIIFLNPYIHWMPTPIGNFIGNIVSVGVLGWPVIWLLSKWFAWWLVPTEVPNKGKDIGGAILILLIIAIMGLIFYFIGFPVANVDSI
jgi:antibiotic biosynthesis monooxygenase (ABM) superfamily enzyme